MLSPPGSGVGWLTSEAYLGEWSIACLMCGGLYSHIREAGTLLGLDPNEGSVYPGTHLIGTTPSRRSAVSITFDGECGHAWELRIQQHKGVNLFEVYEKDPER